MHTYKKPFMKAVTWRIIASVTTVSLVYLATGSFDLTLRVGVFETGLKIAFYIIHERAWERRGGKTIMTPTMKEMCEELAEDIFDTVEQPTGYNTRKSVAASKIEAFVVSLEQHRET